MRYAIHKSKYNPIPRKYFTVLLLAVLFLPSGCSLEYLYHAAVGQYQLLSESIPVQVALDEDILSSEQKEQLRLVAKIKAFGENELGLRKTDSYETVFLKSGRRPIYTVSASLKDSLHQKTWGFPIVGEMPYLGFFELERAKQEGEKLSGENLDVFIGAAAAYSTLGWFSDPVTENLLTGSTPDLAETILHEMTHTTLYLKRPGRL
jgi:predicted aminopeptidase